MELWIREQNRKILRKVDVVGVFKTEWESQIATLTDECTKVILGKYSTEQQALDVLDEIQAKMTNSFLLYNASIIYQMPEDEGADYDTI